MERRKQLFTVTEKVVRTFWQPHVTLTRGPSVEVLSDYSLAGSRKSLTLGEGKHKVRMQQAPVVARAILGRRRWAECKACACERVQLRDASPAARRGQSLKAGRAPACWESSFTGGREVTWRKRCLVSTLAASVWTPRRGRWRYCWEGFVS